MIVIQHYRGGVIYTKGKQSLWLSNLSEFMYFIKIYLVLVDLKIFDIHIQFQFKNLDIVVVVVVVVISAMFNLDSRFTFCNSMH